MNSWSNTFKAVVGLCVWYLFVVWILHVFDSRHNQEQIEEIKEVKIERIFLADIKDPNDTTLFWKVQQELPHAPYDYWHENINLYLQLNESCAKFAEPLNLNYYNTYWQESQWADVRLRLYSAYFDNRTSVPEAPVVRVLGLSNANEDVPESFCQLWYEKHTKPVIMPLKINDQTFPEKLTTNNYRSHVLTCVLPPEMIGKVPRAVSLVGEPCQMATNNLKVHNFLPLKQKQPIAVCMRGLNFGFSDNSHRLVEWFELLRLLGAHKVFAYELPVHANVSKVFEYYREDGFLQLEKTSLGSGIPRVATRLQHQALQRKSFTNSQGEQVLANDCFYRHINEYEFIAVLNMNEIILPLGNSMNWAQLIELGRQLEQGQIQTAEEAKCLRGYNSFCFEHFLFPYHAPISAYARTHIPSYMNMLQHTMRWANHSRDDGESSKCFYNTAEVRALHNNLPAEHLMHCKPLTINARHAKMQHYVNWYKAKREDNHVIDQSLWAFKEPLIERSRDVLKHLGFLK